MNLGVVLEIVGRRETATDHLEEAVAAYREALKEDTRDRTPLQWGYCQQGLANSLAEVAERKKSPALMEEALASMRNAADAYVQVDNRYLLPGALRRVEEIKAELAGLER